MASTSAGVWSSAYGSYVRFERWFPFYKEDSDDNSSNNNNNNNNSNNNNNTRKKKMILLEATDLEEEEEGPLDHRQQPKMLYKWKVKEIEGDRETIFKLPSEFVAAINKELGRINNSNSNNQEEDEQEEEVEEQGEGEGKNRKEEKKIKKEKKNEQRGKEKPYIYTLYFYVKPLIDSLLLYLYSSSFCTS